MFGISLRDGGDEDNNFEDITGFYAGCGGGQRRDQTNVQDNTSRTWRIMDQVSEEEER